MIWRWSMASFIGTSRTLVAVGIAREASMFVAVRSGAPRSGVRVGSVISFVATICWRGRSGETPRPEPGPSGPLPLGAGGRSDCVPGTTAAAAGASAAAAGVPSAAALGCTGAGAAGSVGTGGAGCTGCIWTARASSDGAATGACAATGAGAGVGETGAVGVGASVAEPELPSK